MTEVSQRPPTDATESRCPVCGVGALESAFSMVVLDEHEATYYECAACASLIVLNPYWLPTAYDETRPDPDTGTAQRSILCSLFVRAMHMAGLVRRGAGILDFGAGNGLLVRLLRDQGFDAHGLDKHASMAVARNWRYQSLEEAAERPCDMVTAIEVFEHLPDPCEVLQRLVAVLPDHGMLLLRTSLYDRTRHDREWYYLEPTGGQHITLYSRRGLCALAERCGWQAVFLPFGFHLLMGPSAKPVHAVRKGCLLLVSGVLFAIARCIGLCDCSHSTMDKREVSES